MKLKDFQKWLNAHGASIAEDGLRGPETRAAILKVFSNLRATRVTDADIARYAARLGGTVKQVRAVAKVESAGGGFNDQGQPKALYERHYAYKRVAVKIPLLSDPVPGGYTIDADKNGLNDSWEKIADMAMRNPLVGFESASFGMFQIMGAWAERLGYANAIEFAYSMVAGEAGHYESLIRYVERMGLTAAFRKLSTNPADCVAFAKAYNGPGYAKNAYDRKLAAAMR
jgi:hypothetical protein